MKNNTELASELTIAFITSWNNKNTTVAINSNDAVEVLKAFKKALDSFETK